MAEAAGLVERARRGDRAAWRAIYAEHGPAVRRVCAGFATLSQGDLEDAVQDTFVRAFQHLDSLRDPALLRAWLCTIARSRCLNRLSARQSESRAQAAFAVDPTQTAAVFRHDDSVREREQRIAIVRQLILALPAGPEAETVRLFYLDGELSAQQIAERLGVGKSAVTMRLERFRARVKRRLAALLQRAGVEPE